MIGSSDLSLSNRGVFISLSGVLETVIEIPGMLDGKSLFDVWIGNTNGLSGNSLVFGAVFTDGSSGVYRADFGIEPTLAVSVSQKSWPSQINTLDAAIRG